MKRVNLFSSIIFSVMILAGSTTMSAGNPPAVASGHSQTSLGEYQITELEPETIDKDSFRKFQINYENGSAPITIHLNELSKCNEFIVRSNVMEIQYVCKKSGFGATTVKNKYSIFPEQTNNMFLSTEALRNQSKLTNRNISVEKALGLIACYYPALLKNIQNISAN